MMNGTSRFLIHVVFAALALAIFASGCGEDYGEPVSASLFCGEVEHSTQQMFDQWDVIVVRLDTLNTVNAIAVSRALKSEANYLLALTEETREISTNITSEDKQAYYDELAEDFRDSAQQLRIHARHMYRNMVDYSESLDPVKLDRYFSNGRTFCPGLRRTATRVGQPERHIQHHARRL